MTIDIDDDDNGYCYNDDGDDDNENDYDDENDDDDNDMILVEWYTSCIPFESFQHSFHFCFGKHNDDELSRITYLPDN